MLLNTDWTIPGNEKKVTLVTEKVSLHVSVPERALTVVTIENGQVNTANVTLGE